MVSIQDEFWRKQEYNSWDDRVSVGVIADPTELKVANDRPSQTTAGVLEMPTTTSSVIIWQMIDGKLHKLGHEFFNVQVLLTEANLMETFISWMTRVIPHIGSSEGPPKDS